MSAPEVDQAFRDAWRRLEADGIESARLDARLLLGLALGGGAEKVLAEKGRTLTDGEARHLDELLERRLAREPMSHIVGLKEFWSLDFKVTGATLTPRPDTETLIEAVLEYCPTPPSQVLDLGTGTGCILLALLSEWPNASGCGVDASEDALTVARDNARALGLDGRTTFVRADWREDGWESDIRGPFEVVVSNPPYIPTADIARLDEDVRGFEPRGALDGGADGLDAYRILVHAVQPLLCANGLLAFEVGIGQAGDVESLLADAGFEPLETRRDLGGIARVVVARK